MVPAVAWPTDFPAGWPTPTANVSETTPVSDDLYGWSVVDYVTSVRRSLPPFPEEALRVGWGEAWVTPND